MSTRCSIAVVYTDGSVHSVYCHHDGYPSGVGKTLQEKYNSLDKAEELVAYGNMSAVHGVESPEYYDEPLLVSPSLKTYIAEHVRLYDSRYDYIFIEGEWRMIVGSGKNVVIATYGPVDYAK